MESEKKIFSSKQTKTKPKNKMAKFSEINPNTKKVWRLQELHDAYSDSQKKVEALQATTSLEYSWSRICKEGRILIQKQLAEETRSIWSDLKKVSNEAKLSFELINHPTK
jgi:hypothetical protein